MLVFASLNWSCFAVPLSHGFVGITRSPAWHRNERAARRRARLAVQRGVATEVQRKRLTSHHGSCDGAEWSKATARVEMWRVPALDLEWVHNAGIVEVTVRRNRKGRILGDAVNLESACKEDITATLRHHESLLKSINAGAPATARDAIASRIEILKQAIYAKEPFHAQLVKVQAALTRAEEVAEKKHSAVWTAREAADKADQHVLNLRQRMAELTERIYTDTDTGMNEEPWSCGEWQDAGGSRSGWQWDQPDGDVKARAVGERTGLGMEVENLRGAVPGLQ